MDGVTVLSEQIVGGIGDIISCCIIAVVLGLIVAAWGCWIADLQDFTFFIAFACLVSIFLIVTGCITNIIPLKTYSKYKVTISNEVSFNEFNEKYEIINQEGQIYTVKEKD